MSLKRYAIQAPAGRLAVGGLGLLRATDISLSIAVNELTARSGCDASYWFRGEDLKDITGSFVCQDIGPDLEAKLSGGTLETSGFKVVDRKAFTIGTNAITLDATPLLNGDGTLAGVIYYADSNGETVLTQIAADGAPAAGEYSYQSADDTVDFSGLSDGTVVYVTYAYTLAGNKMVKVMSTTVAPSLGLLLPLCGRELTAHGTKSAAGLFLPSVKFLGRDYNASTGGGEFAGMTFNFAAQEASDGELYRMI